MIIGLVTRKTDFVECEQQRRRPACASVQSDQCFCCSPARQYNSLACYRGFNILASPRSWADWFESYLVGNPEDRFSRYEAHICMADIHVLYRLVDLLIICYVWGQKILPRVHVVARSEVTAVDNIKCKQNGLLLPKNHTTNILESMTTIKNI